MLYICVVLCFEFWRSFEKDGVFFSLNYLIGNFFKEFRKYIGQKYVRILNYNL